MKTRKRETRITAVPAITGKCGWVFCLLVPLAIGLAVGLSVGSTVTYDDVHACQGTMYGSKHRISVRRARDVRFIF